MYINWKRKELVFTIALYGPQGSGKTTTWEYVARKAVEPPRKGEDSVSLYLQDVQGKHLLLNLRDTDGGQEGRGRRRTALYGVDGIIFVADSAPERLQANMDSLYELEGYLGEMNKTVYMMPFLFQYNKRDLTACLDLKDIQTHLNPDRIFSHQATAARRGDGLLEVVQTITDLILAAVLQ